MVSVWVKLQAVKALISSFTFLSKGTLTVSSAKASSLMLAPRPVFQYRMTAPAWERGSGRSPWRLPGGRSHEQAALENVEVALKIFDTVEFPVREVAVQLEASLND